MASEFRLELNIRDLIDAISALDDVSSQLSQIAYQTNQHQSEISRRNVSGLSKLVEAIKKKQAEIADAFMNSRVGLAMQQWRANLTAAGELIRRGIVNPLGRALSIARNMGLAILGAASAALYFSRGTTEKQVSAKSSGFGSLREAKNFEYANEMTGRQLNMHDFNNILNSNTEGWQDFGTLGLKGKDKSYYQNIARKKGTAEAFIAFQKDLAEAIQKGEWTDSNGQIYRHKLEALRGIMGNVDEGFIKSFFMSNGIGSSTDWIKHYRENPYIGYEENAMVANDRAMTRLTAQLDNLKSKLVGLFAPELEKVINGIADGLKRLHHWLNSSEGQSAMQKFKDGLAQVADLIKNVLVGTLIGIAKLAHKTGLIDLDQGTLDWLETLKPQKSLQEKSESTGILGDIYGTRDYTVRTEMARANKNDLMTDLLLQSHKILGNPALMTSLSAGERARVSSINKSLSRSTAERDLSDKQIGEMTSFLNAIASKMTVNVKVENASGYNLHTTAQVSAGAK